MTVWCSDFNLGVLKDNLGVAKNKEQTVFDIKVHNFKNKFNYLFDIRMYDSNVHVHHVY